MNAGLLGVFGSRFEPLTSCQTPRYDYDAGWSSLVARWAHNPKVGGSNPSPATNLKLHSIQVFASLTGGVRQLCFWGYCAINCANHALLGEPPLHDFGRPLNVSSILDVVTAEHRRRFP